MIVLGIVCIFFGLCFAYLSTSHALDNKVQKLYIVFIALLVTSYGITILCDKINSTKSLHSNTVKIEVRQEVVNGSIVSSDTVYIFKPKNK